MNRVGFEILADALTIRQHTLHPEIQPGGFIHGRNFRWDLREHSTTISYLRKKV
jgi:hypothetical protein